MNKSLSYVNLSLELHVISTFFLGSDLSRTFSLYFAQPSFGAPFGAELTFVVASFLQKYP